MAPSPSTLVSVIARPRFITPNIKVTIPGSRTLFKATCSPNNGNTARLIDRCTISIVKSSARFSYTGPSHKPRRGFDSPQSRPTGNATARPIYFTEKCAMSFTAFKSAFAYFATTRGVNTPATVEAKPRNIDDHTRIEPY